MHLIAPAIGLLRELSPEVPPDVHARLILGEPPEALRPFAHPVATLLRHRWKQLGCNRIDTAKQLAVGSNSAKTFRRIDQVLNGERLLPEWLKRLVAHLETPEADLTAAWTATTAWEEKIDTFYRHRTRHQTYARFGPYLLPLPPVNAPPPPDTRVSHDQCIEDLLEVHGDPDPAALAPWLQSHANHFIEGKSPIAGWLYLRAPEELHFFSTDGTHHLTGHADLPTPPNMETPYVPLWRNRPWG